MNFPRRVPIIFFGTISKILEPHSTTLFPPVARNFAEEQQAARLWKVMARVKRSYYSLKAVG